MSNLRDQLLAIREKHGYLDPAIVVEEARDKRHPLHARFEWDDKVAGEAYRRQQAHELIQVVRKPYDGPNGPKDVRAFIAVPRPDSKQPAYEPVEEVMQDEMTRKIVLAQMEREWRTLQARYGDLVEFGDLIREALAGAA